MAFDLSKVDTPSRSMPQQTFREDTTMPRGTTDLPNKEINASIRRPSDTSNSADALARALGIATDTASTAFKDIQANKDAQDTSAAELDFSSGTPQPDRYNKSRAYRDAWQLQGAKKLGTDIGAEVTQKVNERLNDSENPATPQEIDQIIEGVFKNHTTDANGKLLNFGTPEAKMTLANAMSEVRAGIIPQALSAIKKQTDTKFLGTWAYNSVNEFYRGGVAVGNHPDHPGGTDPLAPLPDAQVPDVTKPYYAPASTPKLVEPFKGFNGGHISSGLGAPRPGHIHNGEDYPVAVGTQIVAPSSGKVIASFSNAEGGNQVRVQMADGAIVGFAHLSDRQVQKGDTASAGQLLGASGNTGHSTGPHVHMTVEVDGKKVSAKSYFSGNNAPSRLPAGAPNVALGDEPQLLTANPAAGAPNQLPPFDFEKAMAQVPPGIAKGDAKNFLLQSLFNTANEKGDIGLLKGLEDSKRADGTPSFSPSDIDKIITARQTIDDRVRVDADRNEKQLQAKNQDILLTAMISDHPPSEGFIVDAAKKRLIDPNVAFSIIREQHAQAKADATQARYEARLAQQEDDAATDDYVNGLIATREVGHVVGADVTDDTQLLDSGKLGSGKRALARFQKLRAASAAGEQQNLRNPDFATYAGDLHDRFGTKPTGWLAKRLQGQVNYTGLISYYKRQVMSGTDPAEAYNNAITKFVPKNSANAIQARKDLLAEMAQRRAAAGR